MREEKMKFTCIDRMLKILSFDETIVAVRNDRLVLRQAFILLRHNLILNESLLYAFCYGIIACKKVEYSPLVLVVNST